ncbi:protein SMAX1-LIKE 6-like [Prosopis cineraria]|uniref:protein SMAX1-LIKE 6-like n=1 Tax=Prosopis cineraria TaxID=364024 RepID=UPI00240ED315|nr:protein SMAX1-LIKE 6-like [Prosopis cineraria]
MPTPVNAARQCLTEEAARALDDAVAVARRRSHAQTTSLHVVSALLALPSSKLREACTRAGSSPYSPRLQLRALELSVGVSLDRLPTSKALEEDPPVSNSLMAAIKRSQANQRRHPESFHLFQMHILQNQQQPTASLLKVELKHFVLSILDDPIVSRVFGEAGFRSCDIKLSLLQPPVTQTSRFPWSRCPPIFSCNLPGSESGSPSFKFPFVGNSGYEGVDENCRRIGEVLVRKTRRNPLLMGIYAKSALRSFTESVQKSREGVLPAQIAGLNVVSIEKDISEILDEGGSEEKMGLKFKELSRSLEQYSGPGIAVNFGELDVFVREGVPHGAASFVVSQLTSLLGVHGEKIWVVGIAGTSDVYSKFVALFPTIEKDWDLHLLTITSATPSMEGLYPKSSLMGSFVPFGGFFSSPSELKNPLSCTNQSFMRCHSCNQKYEQEVADILKVSPATLASGYPTNFPWSQKASVETDQGLDVAKSNEENPGLSAKIFGLQKKWSDFCERLHQTQSIPEFGTSQTMSKVPVLGGFPFSSSLKESSSKLPSFNESQHSHDVNVRSSPDQAAKVSKIRHTDKLSPWINPSSMANTVLEGRSSSSFTSVTTDLGLGTIYASAAQEPNSRELQNHKERLQLLDDNNLHQNAGPSLEGKFKSVDFKSLSQVLTETVGWQEEAISAIIQTLSLCNSRGGKHHGQRVRTDIWFAFLGPDRVGKKKIASILAKTIFGNTGSLISLDLNSQDKAYSLDSIFESQNSNHYDIRRKTDVGFIAGELSKKPHAVVFLENVDKADILVQNSLFQALRTGKFPDSHGREISIHNAIFIVNSTVSKCNGTSLSEKEPTMFPEERIVEAKRFQMQLLLREISVDAPGICGPNVIVTPSKGSSKQTFLNKRKQVEISDNKEWGTTSKIQKQVQDASRSYLDLNMPVEEFEDDMDHNDSVGESKIEGSQSQAWLNDFCDQTDEKVVFKPLNFDVLAEKIMQSISTQFERTFGSQFLLEIEYEVMTQMLAAAWLSDKENAVEDWIEHVLGKSFNEGKHKYRPSTKSAMKLVSCEGILVEEQVPGVCLPARINFN